MPFLNAGDIRLHYLFEHNEGYPTLVFANSLGTDLSMWDEQVSCLRERFSIIRFDMRGHGKSSVPRTSFSIEDIASDVIALLNHLQIEEASFCGLSMGGLVGQWLALHAADRFRCFVLCNTAARIGTHEMWNERIDLVMSKGMQAIVPSVLTRWFTSGFRETNSAVVDGMAETLGSTDASSYSLSCAAIRNTDFRNFVGQIQLPTLVVYGTEDLAVPDFSALDLCGKIPNASSLPLRAAHLSNIEAPRFFTEGILRFLIERQGGQSYG